MSSANARFLKILSLALGILVLPTLAQGKSSIQTGRYSNENTCITTVDQPSSEGLLYIGLNQINPIQDAAVVAINLNKSTAESFDLCTDKDFSYPVNFEREVTHTSVTYTISCGGKFSAVSAKMVLVLNSQTRELTSVSYRTTSATVNISDHRYLPGFQSVQTDISCNNLSK